MKAQGIAAIELDDERSRFIQDRDRRIVHDVYRATPEYAIDATRNRTFFHF